MSQNNQNQMIPSIIPQQNTTNSSQNHPNPNQNSKTGKIRTILDGNLSDNSPPMHTQHEGSSDPGVNFPTNYDSNGGTNGNSTNSTSYSNSNYVSNTNSGNGTNTNQPNSTTNTGNTTTAAQQLKAFQGVTGTSTNARNGTNQSSHQNWGYGQNLNKQNSTSNSNWGQQSTTHSSGYQSRGLTNGYGTNSGGQQQAPNKYYLTNRHKNKKKNQNQQGASNVDNSSESSRGKKEMVMNHITAALSELPLAYVDNTLYSGEVKFFNRPKAYGFLATSKDAADDVFVHASCVVGAVLLPGDQVTFRLAWNHATCKNQAVDVRGGTGRILSANPAFQGKAATVVSNPELDSELAAKQQATKAVVNNDANGNSNSKKNPESSISSNTMEPTNSGSFPEASSSDM